MLNDYENEINVNKEIIDALPKNNIKNRKKCVEEIEKMHAKALSDKKKIYGEIESRHIKYSSYTLNPEIEKLNKKTQDIFNKLFLLNEVTTPYEKSGLDRIFYRLDHFFEETFEAVNNLIIDSIGIFRTASIELTIDDFLYSIYTLNYMKEIFAQTNKKIDNVRLKEVFDALYWKCPDIIKQITINFKYLYYLNKKKFDAYFIEEKQRFLYENNADVEKVLNDYINLKEKQNFLIGNDKYLVLNKFVNRIFDLKDYSKDQIERNYRLFLEPAIEIDANINAVIMNLLSSLYEYKNYLKYKFIIDDIKKLYTEKDKYQKLAIPKKKELDKIEKELIKTSKKLNKLILKNKSQEKQENLANKVNIMINQVEALYKEYEETLFFESIAALEETTSLYEALTIGVSNYRYIIKLMKTTTEDIKLETINNELDEIKNFLLNNELSVLKNIYITDQRDIAIVIKDKYNLFGLDIKSELFEEENLDNLIKAVEGIVNNIYFSNIGIDIDNIKFVCNSLDLIEKKDESIAQ